MKYWHLEALWGGSDEKPWFTKDLQYRHHGLYVYKIANWYGIISVTDGSDKC